jgi:hypothetical protein
MRNLSLLVETKVRSWNQSSKLKPKFQVKKNLDEIKVRNWKSKFEIENQSFKLKLKFEVEIKVRSWNQILK